MSAGVTGPPRCAAAPGTGWPGRSHAPSAGAGAGWTRRLCAGTASAGPAGVRRGGLSACMEMCVRHGCEAWDCFGVGSDLVHAPGQQHARTHAVCCMQYASIACRAAAVHQAPVSSLCIRSSRCFRPAHLPRCPVAGVGADRPHQHLPGLVLVGPGAQGTACLCPVISAAVSC